MGTCFLGFKSPSFKHLTSQGVNIVNWDDCLGVLDLFLANVFGHLGNVGNPFGKCSGLSLRTSHALKQLIRQNPSSLAFRMSGSNNISAQRKLTSTDSKV